MKVCLPSVKRRRHDTAFRTAALRLASESRSTQAAARVLGICPKLPYKWRKQASPPWLPPVGPGRTRPRRPNWRQAQELDILKIAIAIFSATDNP